MLLFFMAPLLLLQSKAQAAEISLTAENFPDAVVLKAAKKADKDGNRKGKGQGQRREIPRLRHEAAVE